MDKHVQMNLKLWTLIYLYSCNLNKYLSQMLNSCKKSTTSKWHSEVWYGSACGLCVLCCFLDFLCGSPHHWWMRMFSLIWHEDEVGLDTSLNSCNESEQMKTFLPTFYKQKKGGSLEARWEDPLEVSGDNWPGLTNHRLLENPSNSKDLLCR